MEALRRELDRLDAVANAAMRQLEADDQRTIAAWSDARAAFAAYAEAEDNLIDVAAMLHWRYFDARTPLRTRMLRYRIGFLEELLSHFAGEGHEEPASGETAETKGGRAAKEQDGD